MRHVDDDLLGALAAGDHRQHIGRGRTPDRIAQTATCALAQLDGLEARPARRLHKSRVGQPVRLQQRLARSAGDPTLDGDAPGVAVC